MSRYRHASLGRIDRTKPLSFRFNGDSYQGFAGDTLASALLANGVHMVGRSFKYHRPRGILGARSEEPNALALIDRGAGRRTPNTRMTEQEIFDGLSAQSQNHWPSLKHDVGVVNDWLGRFIPAGFYYKTFMWPKSFWTKVYEPVIRATAGLGKPPTEADADSYSAQHVHCDVLIVGSGPAGLAAALAAGRSGAAVIVCDEQAELGGSLLDESGGTIDGLSMSAWRDKALAELSALPNVTLKPRTTAIGYYHQNFLGLAERLTDHLATAPAHAPRERLWKLRAKQVVLAQGAIEKPLVFDGNDRPGVMLAGAARAFLNRYGVLVGETIVVATTHDAAWLAAFDLAEAGAHVAAIADLRDTVAAPLLERAKALGIAVHLAHSITGTGGRGRVASVTLHPLSGHGKIEIGCDCLLMSGGFTPSVHLFSHTQGKLNWNEALQAYLPGESPEQCRCAGAGNGVFALADVLAEGAKAGAAAAQDAGFKANASAYAVSGTTTCSGIALSELPAPGDRSLDKAFIDFQNDVTAKDIRLAVREGLRSIEHIKRFTTTGMATDQGKTANINGLRVASDALKVAVPQVGLTTFRPPFTPTTFGALVGHARGALFDPVRKTPIDGWADAHGAVFEPVALWRRARYFPHAGEDMHKAVARECRAVRESAGIFDASTLGKIEVKGPDAAEFLDRFYVNDMKGLKAGRCRYAILLGEDGFIRDDGVVGRMAEDCYHVTTTTGGAARVLNMMEDYLQTEWPDLDCWLTSTTEEWAVIAVNGPKARALVEPLVKGVDFSKFPHMAVAEAEICGVPGRLFRVSFTGEVGFELNVPARYGLRVWEALASQGVVPYGTETMHVLRAEKGYIIVGQDTDGTVTPDDAGLNWTIGKAKPDFVGKRSLTRPDMRKSDRRQLVGLLASDPALVLEEGAQIVATRQFTVPAKMIGFVTSSYWSEALGRSVAMALIEGGRAKVGETVYLPVNGVIYEAKVAESPVFYDAPGARLKG